MNSRQASSNSAKVLHTIHFERKVNFQLLTSTSSANAPLGLQEEPGAPAFPQPAGPGRALTRSHAPRGRAEPQPPSDLRRSSLPSLR